MQHIIRPLHTADLAALAALCPGRAADLLGHLRWCLHTPYAEAWLLLVDGGPVGVASVVRFTESARIGAFCIHAPHRRRGLGTALVEGLVRAVQAQGQQTLAVQAPAEESAFWQACGFLAEHAFHRYAGGVFREAVRDEVALMEPAHAMALVHLDRRATGEDRRLLLLEHRFAAHAYTEGGIVRGALLPVLGHGLVLAERPDVGLELQRWLLPSQPHIIVPEGNHAAGEHLLACGYTVVERSVRLVRGPFPVFRPELVFAWPWGRV